MNKLYHPWVGGVEQVVRELAEGMSGDLDVVVLTCQPKGWGRADRVNGVPVARATSIGMFMGMPVSPTLPFLLWRYSRSCDVIHLHFPFPIGALAYLIAASRSPKLIIHHHSDLVRQKGFLTLHRWLARVVLRRADEVIATSPQLAEASPLLAPMHERCRVIPLFGRSLPSPSTEDVSAFRRAQGLGPQEKAVLFVGRLAYYKGLHVLLEAMQEVEGQLWIVGGGPLTTEVHGLIGRLELGDRVEVFSGVSDQDLALFYEAADVFVLPSIAPSEAFGLVQVEAMARGLPVVNTDLPTGVPWVSLDGVTGFTVPPGDHRALRSALRTLLEDDELRAGFGRAARQRARMFSRDEVLAQIRDLYEAPSASR